MWTNVEQPRQATDNDTIRRIRTACWIPKSTDTQLEYVIVISFPLQWWSHERASYLLLRTIACHVETFLKKCKTKPLKAILYGPFNLQCCLVNERLGRQVFRCCWCSRSNYCITILIRPARKPKSLPCCLFYTQQTIVLPKDRVRTPYN